MGGKWLMASQASAERRCFIRVMSAMSSWFLGSAWANRHALSGCCLLAVGLRRFRFGGGLVPQSIRWLSRPICLKNNLFNIFLDGLSQSSI